MGRTKERDWVVPEHLPEMLRDREYVPIDPDTEALAFQRAAGTLHDIGGALQIAPVRVEIDEGRFVTLGYKFRWTLFSPAQHLPKDQHEVEDVEPSIVEPDPEPVGA